jgi:hypothetical protein
MPVAIFEIFENTEKLKTEAQRVEYLSQFRDNTTLQTILVGAFFPGVQWNLPPGEPPFTPCDPVNAEGFLYQESRRLYLFCVGGPDMSNLKRESLFIEMLESVHPKDAQILLAMKEKKLPYKAITKTLVQKAFPGLIDNEEDQEVS